MYNIVIHWHRFLLSAPPMRGVDASAMIMICCVRTHTHTTDTTTTQPMNVLYKRRWKCYNSHHPTYTYELSMLAGFGRSSVTLCNRKRRLSIRLRIAHSEHACMINGRFRRAESRRCWVARRPRRADTDRNSANRLQSARSDRRRGEWAATEAACRASSTYVAVLCFGIGIKRT